MQPYHYSLDVYFRQENFRRKKPLERLKKSHYLFFPDMKLISTKRVHINRIKIADNAYFFCTLMEMNGYIYKYECT